MQIAELSRYQIGHPLEDGPDLRLFSLSGKEPGAALALRLLDHDLTHPQDRRRVEELWETRRRLMHPALIAVLDLYWRGRKAGLVVPDLGQEGGWQPYPFDSPLEQRLLDALVISELLVYLHRRGFCCGLLSPVKLWRGPQGVLLNVVEGARPESGRDLSPDRVRYASPEFLQGRPPDALSDLYSLGMLLYRLLTGSPPLQEDDPAALRQKQMLASPADPRRLQPTLPEEAVQIVSSLTHKERPLRPSSADSVVTALRSACASMGLTPRPSPAPPLRAGLTGREPEVDRLRRLLDEYQEDGLSRLLVVRGAAGAGKSRLLERLAKLAASRRIEQLDGEEPWSGSGRVLLLGGRGPAAQALADLHDDPQAGKPGPLMALEECVGESRALPEQHPWLCVIDLAPLTSEESRHLVEDALAESLPPERLQRLLAQGCGNPFFLMECLQQMVRSGELRFRRGRWRRDPLAFRSGAPPASLVESLRRQVEKLPPPLARIMRVLALAGDPLRLSMLAEALDDSLSSTEERLGRLQELRLARLTGTLSNAWASLHHSWAAAALAPTLDAREGRRIHLAVAAGYRKRLCPHSSSAELASAFKHSLRGGDAEQVNLLARPAIEGLEAEAQFAPAARLLEEASASGLLEEAAWRVQLRLLRLLFRCGELERCQRLGSELLDHPQLQESTRRARLLALLARADLLRGEGSKAIDGLERALRHLQGQAPLELDNQVRGELLAALAYRGRRQEARPLARHLLREIEERSRHRSFDKVCHALFLYFYLLRGDSRRAIAWEVKAIDLAFQAGRQERALGRLLSLVLMRAEQGRLSQAASILNYVRRVPALSRHAEAGLFARLAECLLLRRRGRHSQALQRLHELQAANRSANRSRNLGSALHIEQARNYNHLLQPQRALESLQRSRRLLEEEEKFEDALDILLEEVRAWLLLGRSGRARRLLSRPECSLPSPRRLDFALLAARLHLQEGDSAQAIKLAAPLKHHDERGLEALLTTAQAHLAGGEGEEARRLGEQAWQASRAADDDHLQIQALTLLSECDLERDEPSRAALLARRGLQICVRLQAPPLRAGLLGLLGRALARQEQAEAALRCFSQALLILKEALFHLSAGRRRSFARLHIEPLERRRARLLRRHQRADRGSHLVHLRRWMSALDKASQPRQWAPLLLEAVTACLPAAGRVYLAEEQRQEPFQIASRGDCRHDGRALFHQPGSQAFDTLRWQEEGALSRLGIPLIHPSGRQGLLYLECPRQAVSETEIDYLLCLTACLEMRWERHLGSDAAASGRGEENQAQVPVTSQKDDSAIIGRDPAMLELMEQVRRIAPASATVLISGESGTGKELVARALHRFSRRPGPFVAVNCSGMPRDLIESELFGHAKGAFTGAAQDKRGLFEAASGGTLFLDEIASMPAGLQQSLLRALQEGRIRRVGETRERGVNVRVVSASNQPLPELVSQGDFRADLYHRLNVCHLQIPPLRRRSGDVPLLASHFLGRLCRDQGRKVRLSSQAMQTLASYHFPGNVRELHNLIESAFYLAEKRTISADDLRPRLQQQDAGGSSFGRHRQAFQQMISGGTDFWRAVRDPFLERDLSRSDVRRLITLGLTESAGSYRKLTALFNLPDKDYKRFMSFLAHHDCKVDFRPFRSAARESAD
ncbi:MAG TPA: sigma 54-interacting transcriptional regulator [Acidobacteriota bacterium]|nr:sigma 54-interacting transcriptional regulator [Acidobacteriota bacterium]